MPEFIKKLLCIAGLLYLASTIAHMRFVSPPPGVLAPQEPFQNEEIEVDPFRIDDFIIYPLAEFSLKARVLATERYRFDSIAGIVPLDVAFGWGPMSDSEVLNNFSIWQGGRFFFWSMDTSVAISVDEVKRNAANMHLIPANKRVRRKILALRVDDTVALEGYLVEAKRGDGVTITSSLSREDSGGGACEVIWVTSLDVSQ